MNDDKKLIFLYGKFKRDDDLSSFFNDAEFIGEGVINGFIFNDVDKETELVHSQSQQDVVHGEIYEVADLPLIQFEFILNCPLNYIRETVNCICNKQTIAVMVHIYNKSIKH